MEHRDTKTTSERCKAFRFVVRIFWKTDALLLMKRCVPHFEILRMEKGKDTEIVLIVSTIAYLFVTDMASESIVMFVV